MQAKGTNAITLLVVAATAWMITSALGVGPSFAATGQSLSAPFLRAINPLASFSDSKSAPAAPRRLAQISLPRISPYEWSASKAENGSVVLKGYAPDGETKAGLLQLAGSKALDITDLGQGAPDGFAAEAKTGLKALADLQSGLVRYDGAGWSISGTAATFAEGEKARKIIADAALEKKGWRVVLDIPKPEPSLSAAPAPELPLADPFTFEAAWDGKGFMLSGHVPSTALPAYLKVHMTAPVTGAPKPARGAPQGFAGTLVAGMDALAGLEKGTLRFDGSVWSLKGEAKSGAARDRLEAGLAKTTDPAVWTFDLGVPEPKLAVADPYVWTVTKENGANYRISGSVPSDALKAFLDTHVGNTVADDTVPAAGAPDGFIANALKTLNALALLESGEGGYDGAHWVLSGVPDSRNATVAALGVLSSGDKGATGWRIALKAPPEPAPVAQEANTEAQPATEKTAAATETAQPETQAAPNTSEEPGASAAMPAQKAEEPATEAPAEPAETATAPQADQTQKTTANDDVPALPYSFSAQRADGGPLSLFGEVPSDAAKAYFGVVAGDVATNGLTVNSGAPDKFATTAVAGLRALSLLENGRLSYMDGKWELKGRALEASDKNKALAALSSVDGNGDWNVAIDTVPPAELCNLRLAAFDERNAILFNAGSDKLSASSLTAVDELAGYLSSCPSAPVRVEGYTDSDGDAASNLALSVARAEAVVDALVSRGVAEGRLYAIGYGESLPIASNDTAAGKRRNRRIEVRIGAVKQ